MKVRFYCDIPQYSFKGQQFWARSDAVEQVIPGWRRIMFEVDLPLRDYDEAAPASAAVVVDSGNLAQL